jgi:hypothetical protein
MSSGSSKLVWVGRIVSAFTIAFLLFDSAIHLAGIAPVVQAFTQLGFPPGLSGILGVLELLVVILYVYARTAVLGAVLLTGYLGGAVAVHLRVADPLFAQTLFPVYVGILAWLGLYLREPRLRSLIPIRERVP